MGRHTTCVLVSMRSFLFACCIALPVFGAASGCAVEGEPEEVVGSESDSAYTVNAMPAEVNRRVATCFTRDWSTRKLAVASDPRYSTNVALTVVGKASLSVYRTIGYLVMAGSEGESVLRQLEADLHEIATEQRLEDHQKALLVQCVSSQLISYAFNGFSKFLGAAAAAQEYEGVCTEYAGIYARLIQSLNVDAGVEVGLLRRTSGDAGAHAWNWVEIGGKTLWLEPQRNPLRRSDAVFIDPEGKAPAVPARLSCTQALGTCSEDSECCSGRCGPFTGAKAKTCIPTPCESVSSRICTPASESCTKIGGTPVSASCWNSIDGAACCALDR